MKNKKPIFLDYNYTESMKRANALFLTRERRVNEKMSLRNRFTVVSHVNREDLNFSSRLVSPGRESRLDHSRGYALFFTRRRVVIPQTFFFFGEEEKWRNLL